MGWSEIPSEIRGIVASSVEPFEADTVANANDVVALGARMSLPVAGVAKGYWSTISFGWGDVEVEVFADHVELYDLANGEMDIRHYDHRPGAPLDKEFVQHLLVLLSRLPPG